MRAPRLLWVTQTCRVMCRALCLAMCLVALPAWAAGGVRVDSPRALIAHLAKGLPEVKVGQWVTFRVYGAHELRTAFIRVGVAGEERDHLGRDAYWLDVEMAQHHQIRAPLMQVRLLIARNPAPGEEAVTRAYFAWGTERVRELTPDALARVVAPSDPSGRAEPPEPGQRLPDPSKSRITTGKEQRLLTLAGTVTAVPVEMRYGQTVLKRMWVSREVPILQLAKIEMPAIDHSMEVREYGVNFVSEMILPAPGQPKLGVEALDPRPVAEGEKLDEDAERGGDHGVVPEGP